MSKKKKGGKKGGYKKLLQISWSFVYRCNRWGLINRISLYARWIIINSLIKIWLKLN